MHHKKCKNGVFRAFSLNKMSLLCVVSPGSFFISGVRKKSMDAMWKAVNIDCRGAV